MYPGQRVGRRGNFSARIISHACETRACKVSTIYSKGERYQIRGTLSNWGLNKGEGVGNVRFQRKTGHISKKLEIRPRLLLITNRKWHTPFQIRWKSLTLDDPKGRYMLLWLNGAR